MFVEERTCGEGSWSTGDYRKYIQLEEIAGMTPARRAVV